MLLIHLLVFLQVFSKLCVAIAQSESSSLRHLNLPQLSNGTREESN